MRRETIGMTVFVVAVAVAIISLAIFALRDPAPSDASAPAAIVAVPPAATVPLAAEKGAADNAEELAANYEPPPEPEDRTWYAMMFDQQDCVVAKLVFGVDTPQEVVDELNSRGGRWSYLRQDDFMVGIIEPMGRPAFFVRGKNQCQTALGMALSAG